MPACRAGGGGMDGREPQVEETKVGQVIKELREKIESEEWPHGHKVPSQKKLSEQFGFSVQTVRNAVSALAEVGMIYKRRGRPSRVTWPNPLHQLVIGTRPAALGEPRAPYVELAIGAGTEAVTREWTEADFEV